MNVCAVLMALLSSSRWSAHAFVPATQQRFGYRPLAMSDEVEAPPAPKAKAAAPAAPVTPKGGALVPIKEETVEFTAGLVGGFAGFLIGGPLLGAISAAAANYVSKMEGDVSQVVQTVSKSSIQIFNYLSTLDAKYEILKKAQNSLQNTLDKLKSQGTVDPDAISKVESALSSTKSKIAEINDEYDLVGGGMTALGVVGDLIEKAVKRAGELNEEYKLTDKAQSSLKNAVDRAREAAKEA